MTTSNVVPFRTRLERSLARLVGQRVRLTHLRLEPQMSGRREPVVTRARLVAVDDAIQIELPLSRRRSSIAREYVVAVERDDEGATR